MTIRIYNTLWQTINYDDQKVSYIDIFLGSSPTNSRNGQTSGGRYGQKLDIFIAVVFHVLFYYMPFERRPEEQNCLH